MENLFIAPTKRTPEIAFKTNGELKVSGSSLPENVTHFYRPVLEWLEEFKLSVPPVISLTIDVDYLNTSSTRNIIKILQLLNSLEGTSLNVVWVYEKEDDDMQEQGEIFESCIKLRFTFIEKEMAF